jgi:hypothetical protein
MMMMMMMISNHHHYHHVVLSVLFILAWVRWFSKSHMIRNTWSCEHFLNASNLVYSIL